MEQDFLNKIFSRMKSEKLSAVEKTRLRSALEERMQGMRPTYQEVISVRSRWWQSTPLHFSYVTAFLLLIVFGGFSYASENALPGDALYALKVRVNEPLRGVLAFSPEAKIKVEAEIVERRFDEVLALTNLDSITPEIKNRLMTSAADHTERFANKLAQFEEKVDPSIAVALSSRIESRLESGVSEPLVSASGLARSASIVDEPALMMAFSSEEEEEEINEDNQEMLMTASSEDAGDFSLTRSFEKEGEEMHALDMQNSQNLYENRFAESAKRISELRERIQEKVKKAQGFSEERGVDRRLR